MHVANSPAFLDGYDAGNAHFRAYPDSAPLPELLLFRGQAFHDGFMAAWDEANAIARKQVA
ncbi:hypothetical protein SEA_SKOG_18 [Gordonia phage Skog]|uniref:Uncharacterized protein n=1 Tax=Gordonia phage Skog TaxID=2704033 RepID=A0A6G6XK79_9CAUD|nr:hypothetical protein KHQ85_gp018 [Gordonia phage Skog]QIG58170.1 hypothetical protein SEA_SKOG_18 [Gordonia phage Skog]